MNESRKKQIYKIIKKEDFFKVSTNNITIFTLQCEDLIQLDSILIARQSSGLYSIYLPTYIGNMHWSFKNGFVCVSENVREFYYQNKEKDEFNKGFLFLKIETDNLSGYWTAINVESFEWYLTPERAKTRLDSLFKIPYTGNSKISFMTNFDYLYSNSYLVEIDNIIHLISNIDVQVDSESARMLLKTLGKVRVEPIPSKWLFKVISDEGESFFSTCCHEEACYQVFGPFKNIRKVEFEKEHPICYLGLNENNKILGMIYKKLHENGVAICNDTAKIIFSSPVKDATLIETIKSSNDSIACWKLSYDDGKSNILICSISTNNNICTIIDPSKYI